MDFQVLGPLQVVDGDRAVVISSQRQRALLAFLLVHVQRTVSADRLLDELWGDQAPASGRAAIAFHISRLRRALGKDGDGGGPIRTRDGGYALEVEAEAIDAVRFERLAAEGHAALAADPAAAAERLRAALGLWRGKAFEGLDDFAFTAAEIRRLDELRLRTVEDRLEADLALGRAAEVTAELQALVDREPLRERLRALLIVSLYRSGRQADALQAFHDNRRILSQELGIDPSPQLVALEAAILRQEPELATGGLPAPVADAPTAPTRNPYKGLRPFDEADAADFFGREALTARLVSRLGEVARTSGLLAVIGPSGSGKSSVVRAGLVSALRAGGLPGSERWPIAILFPGARPFEELAAALRSVAPDDIAIPNGAELAADPAALAAAIDCLVPPDGRLLLVIDQLEELWTLSDVPTRERFLDLLTTVLASTGSRPLVVVTLRVDHLEGVLRSAALGPLTRDGSELVPPLGRNELERAIERPATGAGLELEPGLAAMIVADVVDHPAMLPPLQYALTELAEQATDGRLARAGYAAIGGVVGALAGRAEATYAALDPTARETARQVFLRLVAVEPTGEAGARRVVRTELGDERAVTTIVERFAAARLLALGRDSRTGVPTVEIAHEALLIRWPRLASWVDAERDAMWLRRRLGDAAAEWLEHDRDPGFQLAGSRLELFATWAASTDLTLGTAERALLDASLDARDREVAAEADRRAKERRLERRGTRLLRALVAVFALAAVLSTGLLIAVWRQSEAAAEERAIAGARQLAVAANGRLEADPGLALRLALESARASADRGWITEETMDALHWAIQAARIPYPVEETAVGVRTARDETLGVYLLPPDELVELVQTYPWLRELSVGECRTYLGLGACPSERPVPTHALRGVMTADGVVPMAHFVAPSTAGSSVRVWSQLPVDTLALLGPLASRTGTTVQVDATADLATIWRQDVAILARPGGVAELTQPQTALDLRTILRSDETAAIAASPLAELGWVGGQHFGPDAAGARFIGSPIAVTASSLLWYPADAYAEAGYAPPTSWPELEALTRQMIADGQTPWCMGLADGAAGADWIEDLAIDDLGGEPPSSAGSPWLRFDGAAAASAFLRFRELLGTEGALFGGRETALRTGSERVGALMGDRPDPGCWLIHATAVERSGWTGPVREDLRPIPLPVGGGPPTMRGRVYTLIVLRDRPEVRALVRELLGTSLASSLATLDPGTGIVPLGPSGETAWDASAGDIRTALVSALRAGRLWVDASDRLQWDVGETAFPASVLAVAGADDPMVGGLIDQELESLARLDREAQP